MTNLDDDRLRQWQKHVDTRLDRQDGVLADQGALLKTVDDKLDTHIAFAKAGFAKTEPVVEAMQGMRTGIRVIGWIGSKAAAIASVVTAIIAGVLAWKGYFK